MSEIVTFTLLNTALLIWGIVGSARVFASEGLSERIKALLVYIGVQLTVAAVAIGLVFAWGW